MKKILLLIILSLPTSLLAQHDDIKFTHIGLEQGLSQSYILCILQDNQGFMWFGTKDGLNRYDGYRFTVYRHEANNPNSLSDNEIRSCIKDSFGILWIGTNLGGLNKFDPTTEMVTHYRHDPNNLNSLSSNDVFEIYEDTQGILWLGTQANGLNRFDPITETFTHYQPDPANPNCITEGTIETIYQDKSGVLWIGTYNGLNKLEPHSGHFTHYQNDPDNPTSLSSNIVRAIYEDNSNQLWIGTHQAGLNKLDRQTGQFIRYQHEPNDPNSLIGNNIPSIYEDSVGRLWIGTNQGLNLFNRQLKRFIRYTPSLIHPRSLSDHSVISIYENQEGVLWFGTFKGGISQFNPTQQQFLHYQHDPINPNSLLDNNVRSIYVDKAGMVWIGTWNGLTQFDRSTQKWTRYQHDPNNANSLNAGERFSAIYEDKGGDFWIGNWWGGLSRFDRQTAQFQHYRHDPNNPHSLSNDAILSISEDKEGILWLGTFVGGLNRFDKKTEQFHHYQHDPNNPHSLSGNGIRTIYEDSTGVLWLGTWANGLNRFEKKTERFYAYRHDPNNPHSLSSNKVYAIHEDKTGVLWVGTTGGLSKWDKNNHRFYSYTEKDGLPNRVICAILEDELGNLWLSTYKGLSKFNPVTETFRNYHVSDGLQANEFNPTAAYKWGKNFLFGGINGFNIFEPQQIKDNPYIPPIVLTDFKVFNQSVGVGENSLLQKPIWETEAITLSYQQSVFSFEFAALSYTAPHKNQYQYQLEGFETQWNQVDSRQRFATYTNLPASNYIFRVRGSNNDGIWNQTGTAINITITPPPWKTWWAYTLYTLTVFFIIWYFIRAQRQKFRVQLQYTNKLKELNEQLEAYSQSLEAKVKQRTTALAEQTQEAIRANQSKSRFLAAASHDLRQPLQALRLFVETLTKQVSEPQTQALVQKIQLALQALIDLFNSLLDISRLDAGTLKCDSYPFSLNTLVKQLINEFNSPAQAKGLSFQTRNCEGYIESDPLLLKRVLSNLLSNALRYTDEGEIKLTCHYLSQTSAELEQVEIVEIAVSDTGRGIPKEQHDKIFEEFYQLHNPERDRSKGLGLGLSIVKRLTDLLNHPFSITSQPGKGTTFTIQVPFAQAISPETDEREETSLDEIDYTPEGYIVVIDDEAMIRDATCELLEDWGYEVITADSAETALQQLAPSEPMPDFIISDYRLRDNKTGLQAIQAIHQQLGKTIPAILITGDSALQRQLHDVQKIGYEILLKPVDPEHLYEVIKSMINYTEGSPNK